MAVGCRYDRAGSWNGGASCSVGLKSGTQALGEALRARWGGSWGGFSCRPNTADTSQLSVHGTGRAVDWFQPSHQAGDEAARWLVENHEKFGIQLVIWDRKDWSCSALDNVPGVGAGDGWTPYGGPNPHTDHLHIELTIPAANDNTARTYQTGGLSVADIEELIKVIKAQGDLTRKAIRSTAEQTQKVVKAQGELTREKIAAQD